MTMTAEANRLLVVADIWCQIDGLCEHVWSELGDLESDIVVVAPPLASRLHTFTSDLDHETETAKDRLADVLGRLRERGVEARGIIGANDPVLAIDDALARFEAQKIVLITDTPEHENWREHKLPGYLEGLDIPSVRVIVPHDLAAQRHRSHPRPAIEPRRGGRSLPSRSGPRSPRE